MRRFVLLLALPALLSTVAVAPVRSSAAGVAAPDRSVEPVVVSGAQLPEISAGPEIALRRPQVYQPTPANPSGCQEYENRWDSGDPGDHSCSQPPDVRLTAPRTGAPVAALRGWRWDGQRFVQIPFQVDERFTRYLSNNASGFAFYSGIDEHTTYAFDREGYRFTDSLPEDPCRATPYQGVATTPDPVAGLDDNDELAFMASDAGPPAPAERTPPAADRVFEVRVVDPLDPTAQRFVYVSVQAGSGPPPAYDPSNGHVRYLPDDDRDRMVYSQSSYGAYGAAPKGPVCDPNAVDDPTTAKDERYVPLRDDKGALLIRQRRPLDTGWVETSTYRFRYDGRWMMTGLHIADGAGGYGPDVVDRWKARAFAQDPSSNTPCCGYEEEETNWGGSSILMGERAGPVRFIRETWGADSGTNVVRRETFYRDTIDLAAYLRVHPIPPVDGIYTQWDYNAARMDTYYNPQNPDGVTVDGRDDELVGNFDDPCNPRYDTPYGELYRQIPGSCSSYHQSVDVTDPTFSTFNAMLQWEQMTGPHGSVVTRWRLNEVTPGGAVQGLVAAAYYRDNSCFDDGTGTNPGPKLLRRSGNEPQTWNGEARRCWAPTDGDPGDHARFFQGSIGTHGLHLLFVVDSDNAFVTKPVTEIDAVQRMVVLPGRRPNVGETYGRGVEYPLAAVVSSR